MTQRFVVKNQAFESELTNEAAASIVATGTSQFGLSLISQLRQRGSLSGAQWAWVHKLALEAKPKVAVALGNVQGILDLFARAVGTGQLKHPKIHLATEDGLEICLSIAGERSKAPGTVSVTDGGKYGQSKWYGRIKLDGTFEPGRDCQQAITDFLVEFAQDPARVAGEYGRRTGCCCLCNQNLTDERSLLVGYGPVCARNWGLPWGSRRNG